VNKLGYGITRNFVIYTGQVKIMTSWRPRRAGHMGVTRNAHGILVQKPTRKLSLGRYSGR
jgi:hypothetical protein